MIAAPEAIAAAATDLASIGSTIGAANAAAAANTTAVLAAGADQVSVAIAAAFGAHGQAYQALSAQAATFHIQFVQALTAGAGSYAAAEAASAASITSPLLDAINAPFLAALGRPLIGNGADGRRDRGRRRGGGLLFALAGDCARLRRACDHHWFDGDDLGAPPACGGLRPASPRLRSSLVRW